VLATILTALPASAVDDLSSILEQSRGDTPGMVAAVISSDATIAIGAAGVRVRGRPQKVTVDDQFHIGSDTKAMTATLCGLLVEDGKLRWDSKLGEVFPELKPKMTHGWADVTLQQLLTHHAGVEGDSAKHDWWAKAWAPGLDPVAGRTMMLADIIARAPEAPAGTKYIYSNAGYAIAGHMAERVTNTPWERLIVARLFKPLGMAHAGIGPPQGAQPQGHHDDGAPAGTGHGADNPETIGPAGTVHCPIGDWAKFIQLHLKGARGEPTPILKPQTFARLHEPVKARGAGEQDYAMGWLVTSRPWAGGTVLTHAGSNTIWYCEVWIAPKKDFAMLVMANAATPEAQKAVQDVEVKLLKYAK
jgi:CubicO group peptidase (beta-lactamase class C family)